MDDLPESEWLDNFVERKEGYELEAVERYSNRLLQLAKKRLPAKMQPRVDPSDIVQSAFHSFFSRHEKGRFHFKETEDIWRLLAAITYRKTRKNIQFHMRKQRDVQAETNTGDHAFSASETQSPTASSLAVFDEILGRIFARLPKTHQNVLQLRIEGYSIEEISVKLGISSRTVNRGLLLIRKIAVETMEIE